MPFSSAAICWMLRSGMFGFWGINREKDCQIEGFRIALELAHALSMLFSLE